MVKAPNITYEEGQPNGVCLETKSNTPQIICHGCFVPEDHILPSFEHSVTNPGCLVHNYKALEVDNKFRVPDNYYVAAKTITKGIPEHQLSHILK